MKCLSMTLSGKTAHFKRPDVNANVYFTYQHIPKVALLGLFGAIIGLKGYSEQGKAIYPEFYDKLKKLEVSVVPLSGNNGIFSKKIQVFNNSVGYASQEVGNNLIIREQWLENVSWRIYINLDSDVESEILDRLTQYLIEGKSVYLPYLGKNDHFADIGDTQIEDLEMTDTPEYVDSLYPCSVVELEDETQNYDLPFTFKDTMPVGINEHGMYLFDKIGYTNRLVLNSEGTFYKAGEQILYFM